MDFKDFAKKYYCEEYLCEEQKVIGMKNYREGLMDRIVIRLHMLLRVYEYNPDARKEHSVLKEGSDSIEGRLAYADKISEMMKKIEMDYLEIEKEICNKKTDLEDYLEKDPKKSDKIRKKIIRLEEEKKKLAKKYINIEMFGDESIKLFEEVTEEEEAFYRLLLKTIIHGKDVSTDNKKKSENNYTNIRNDEWWVISIEVRREIIERLCNLCKQSKWDFARSSLENTVDKLLRPRLHNSQVAAERVINGIGFIRDILSKKAYEIACQNNNLMNENKSEAFDTYFDETLDDKFSRQLDKITNNLNNMVKVLDDYQEKIEEHSPYRVEIGDNNLKKIYEVNSDLYEIFERGIAECNK